MLLLFQFDTTTKIKEEVEDDPLDTKIEPSDTEIGLPNEISATEMIGIYVDPNFEFDSMILPDQQPEETKVVPHPKLVIKYRDLWAESEESCDRFKESNKREHTEIAGETSTRYEVEPIKRRKTDSKTLQRSRSTRSLSSKSKVSRSKGKKRNGVANNSRKKSNSEMKEMQDVWNLARITDLENNSEILCECCGRGFSTFRHLEAHIRYYTADGVFHCVICKKKYYRNFQLKRHMKAVHTEESHRYDYKFKCQICEDRFRTKSGLIAHVTHLHHQRLKGIKRALIRKRKKARRNEKMKKNALRKKVIFNGESDQEDDVTSSTDKSVDNSNDEEEKFVPASLMIEEKQDKCSDEEILQLLKYAEEISFKMEYDPGTASRDDFGPHGKISKDNKAIKNSQQNTKPQRGNQVCLEIVSENLQPQLRGNLIDHLGNTVGNWCVSESFDTIEGSDNSSHSNSTSVEVSSTDGNEKAAAGWVRQSAKNAGWKRVISDGLNKNRVDDTIRRALARKKESKDRGNKFSPFNMVENIEIVEANVSDDVASVSIEMNYYRERSEFMNIPLENSSTFNEPDVVTLKKFEASRKVKLKDIRVSLVRLEDMVNISISNLPKKSASRETSKQIRSEKVYCSICKIYLSSKRVLERHCLRKHSKKDDSGCESELVVREENNTDKCSSETISKNIEPEEAEKSITTPVLEKHCYLCDEVFRNMFSLVSHYLAVHTEEDVLRCCLCHSEEKTSRNLRYHLYKHFNNQHGQNIPKSCITCTQELNMFSLIPHCLDCKAQLQMKRYSNLGRRSRVRNRELQVSPVEKKYVSLRKKRPPSFLRDTIAGDAKSVADRKSGKKKSKVETEIVKNFKCLACNSMFFDHDRLKHHLLTAHVDVEYRRRETNQKIEPKTINKTKKTGPKLKVGRKKDLKRKVTSARDKPCGKKLCSRKMSKFSGISSRRERCKGQRDFQDGSKMCYTCKCDVCGLKCCCRTCLKIHKKRYSSDGNNSCNICGLTFGQKHALAMHEKTAHNSNVSFYGKLKCEICTQGFHNIKFLRIHLSHFHNMKYLECQTCRVRFNSYRELKDHSQYYSEILSYLCSTCGQIYKCKYMLEYHNARTHDHSELMTYQYSCDVCHCAFRDKLLLQAHIGHFHKVGETNFGDIEVRIKTEDDFSYPNGTDNDSSLENDASDKTANLAHLSSGYKCSLCKLSFTDSYAILDHEWEYSNDGEFTCDLCNRKFMTNFHLKNHKIKHYQRNAIRKYECYVCNEDFLRENDLMMHGLHLHGPKFISGKNSEAVDSNRYNRLNHRGIQDREGFFEKLSVSDARDRIGLLINNNDPQDGKVLLFRKMSNNRSPAELLRRNSNEDSYSCEFCKTNFSSAYLLKDHIKKHAYHAYYTNLSRYLCLICKQKFRTNDILRAHVVYFHTSDREQSISGEPRYSNDPFPAKSIKCETTGISESSPSEHSLPNATSGSKEEYNNIYQQNIILPEKREKLINPVSNLSILQARRVRQAYPARKIRDKMNTNSDRNNTDSQEDRNSDRLNSIQEHIPEPVPRTEIESTSKAVKLFIVKTKNIDKTQKYGCIICLEIFDSVTCFVEHFTNIHVKNQAYLCAFCNGKFSYMSDLKRHIIKHEGDPKHYMCCERRFSKINDLMYHKLSHDKPAGENEHTIENTEEPKHYMCCDKKFSQIKDLVYHELLHDKSAKKNEDIIKHTRDPKYYTCCNQKFSHIKDLVYHKLLHEKQAEDKEHEPDEDLPLSIRIGSLKKSDNKTNANEMINLCKCEICDATFSDFKTLLKHWDSCISKNCLQCDFCGARFKGEYFLGVHKLSCEQNKQSSHVAQKQWDNTIDNFSRGSMIIDTLLSANPNPFKKQRRCYGPANKLSAQCESSKIKNIIVEPPSQTIQNMNGKREGRRNEEQETAADVSTTEPELNQGVVLSNQCKVSEIYLKKMLIKNFQRKISSNINSKARTSLAAKSVKRVSSKISKQADDNHLSSDALNQDSISIDDRNFVKNNFIKTREQRQRSKPSLNIVKNSSSVKPTIRSYIDVTNTRIFGKGTQGPSRESRTNDGEDAKLSNSKLQSPNTVNSQAYHVSVQYPDDRSANICNESIIPSDESPHSNEGNEGLSNLPPVPSNVDDRPSYYLCIESTSTDSDESSNQIVVPNELDYNSHSDNSGNELLEIIDDSTNKSKNNSKLNNFPSELHKHVHENKKAPISSCPVENSISVTLPVSYKNATQDIDHSTKQTDHSEKLEPTLQNRTFRCSYCFEWFSEIEKLNEHLEGHKTARQCPACGIIFSNENGLRQHLREHERSICTKCSMICFFRDSRAYHEGTRKYCPTCKTLLPVPSRPSNHSSANSQRQVTKCGVCMETFDSMYKLSAHFRSVHLSFVCLICQARFSTKYTLRKHLHTHGKEQTSVTSECKICTNNYVEEANIENDASSDENLEVDEQV